MQGSVFLISTRQSRAPQVLFERGFSPPVKFARYWGLPLHPYHYRSFARPLSALWSPASDVGNMRCFTNKRSITCADENDHHLPLSYSTYPNWKMRRGAGQQLKELYPDSASCTINPSREQDFVTVLWLHLGLDSYIAFCWYSPEPGSSKSLHSTAGCWMRQALKCQEDTQVLESISLGSLY